jgi:undecaprenyl-diphosphatase
MNQLITVLLSSFFTSFQELDIRILKYIFESRYIALDPIFVFITNTTAVIAFGLPGIALITGLVNKNRLLWKNALVILIPVAISAIVANILKYTIDLPRPYEIYPFIQKLSVGGSPSFPSGHTADAFAFAVSMGLFYRKWNVVIPVLIWASLVGYSRMCLGVHFPSDVIAGAMIGAASAALYSRFDKRNPKKIGESSIEQ